jgi:hypothetical protein
MERDEEDEDERHSCHTSEASCGPEKKTSEKSPPASSTFANTKFPWLAFLAMAIFLRLVQKRSRGSAKKDGILLI